jgi:transcriptional regulator with XRE-family HTH domain
VRSLIALRSSLAGDLKVWQQQNKIVFESTKIVYFEVIVTKYDEVREELREWCKEKRGRQQKISKTLGVSKQLVAGWMSGRCRMSLEHYLRIQDIRAEDFPKIEYDARFRAQMVEKTEACIKSGLKTFCEVTEALVLIKRDRLYPKKYETFEDYFTLRWGLNLFGLKKRMKILTTRESSFPKF